MVAAVSSWHEHHPAAAAEIARRLERRERLVVAAPALVEAYSVLTRLPSPHRLGAADARAVLEASFLAGSRLVALDARAYRDVLRRAPGEGTSGGRIYDAVIAACARRGRVGALLTFNEDDF